MAVQEPLLPKSALDSSTAVSTRKPIWKNRVVASVALLAFTAVTGVSVFSSSSSSSASLKASSQASLSSKAPSGKKLSTNTAESIVVPSSKSTISDTISTSIRVANQRIEAYGPAGRDYAAHWMTGVIVEPSVDTTFSSEDGAASTWKVSTVGTEGSEYESSQPESSFTRSFTSTGEYHVERRTMDDANANVETGMIFVRYVRREVRSLEVPDRDALFAAWKTVINQKDEVAGKKMYGDDFMSMNRLMVLHNNLAGAKDCDHLHDGMGFLTSHVQITRLLEASLQSVDPSVSLPYWEYTKDVEDIIANYDGNFQEWQNLEIFSEKFFGQSESETATVKEGHFSDLSVIPFDKVSASDVVNSFGLIRAPWNNLNVDKPTRFFGAGGMEVDRIIGTVAPDQNSMSTCANLASVLQKSTTVNYFSEEIAQQAHGPIHLFTGGMAHSPDLMEWIETSLPSLPSASPPSYPQYWTGVVEFFLITQRAAFRYDMYDCPEVDSCSTDQESNTAIVSMCACTCDVDSIMSSDMYKDVFETFGFTKTFSDDLLSTMLAYMCSNSLVVGDHASSSSANDPSFWPMHSTVERYSQLLRLNGAMESENWPADDSCVFSSNIHPFTDTCTGHYADDALAFGSVDGEEFSNAQYYAYLDPTVSSGTYVYDNFEYEHCTDVGVVIDSSLFTGR